MMENKFENHPFEPFLPKNAKVLILGSFPGREQTQSPDINGWFYGAKRNQFWKIISEVYSIVLDTTDTKKKLFEQKGIAITDILKSVRRKENKNSDSNLEIVEYNEALNKILRDNNFDRVLFTSKNVEKLFLNKFPNVSNFTTLPSPSPIYFRMTKAEKINRYKELLPK